jgi:hypothetical protein
MCAEKTDNKTKVLVNVYKPLVDIVKLRFDKACLKRDAYLDKALRIEAGFLRDEVPMPNSEMAKKFIVDNLKQLKPKQPLNLLLSKETAELLNDVCDKKNIPRDAFINRFLLLLTASDSVLKALFSDEAEAVLLEGGDFYGPEEVFYIRSNVIDTIEEFVSTTPFFWLRAGFENSYTTLSCYPFKRNALCSLPDEYDLLKTSNALGFNVFMSGEDIKIDELLQEPDSDGWNLDKFEKIYTLEKKRKAEKIAKVKLAGEAK